MKNIDKIKNIDKMKDNIMSLFVELYPQNRVKHLVRYGSSKRIRNKNKCYRRY